MARTVYNQPGLLLVEGKHDQEFFVQLRHILGLHALQIATLGGVDKLRTKIVEAAGHQGFKGNVLRFGIALDANDAPDARWCDVCSALEAARLPVPERQMEPTRNRPRHGRPMVIVMIMPRSGEMGMLEDVCLRAVAEDPATGCVEDYFDCLQATQGIHLPGQLGKRRLQAFLASRREYVPDAGEAAKNTHQSEIWSWDHEAFYGVKQFLNQIANPTKQEADDA